MRVLTVGSMSTLGAAAVLAVVVLRMGLIQIGDTAAAVRDEIRPNTILYIKTDGYQRLGDNEAAFRQLETFHPEHTTSEIWYEFDGEGALISLHSEVRGSADDVVYGGSI